VSQPTHLIPRLQQSPASSSISLCNPNGTDSRRCISFAGCCEPPGANRASLLPISCAAMAPRNGSLCLVLFTGSTGNRVFSLRTLANFHTREALILAARSVRYPPASGTRRVSARCRSCGVQLRTAPDILSTSTPGEAENQNATLCDAFQKLIGGRGRLLWVQTTAANTSAGITFLISLSGASQTLWCRSEVLSRPS
jgi:hypothetical protein